jgi:hypothetical protein
MGNGAGTNARSHSCSGERGCASAGLSDSGEVIDFDAVAACDQNLGAHLATVKMEGERRMSEL